MRLFVTPTSPYARIVRIMVLERGLGDRVSVERVTVRDPESALLAHSPLGRVPTLETDDGVVLTQTHVICGYLDRLHDGPPVMAAADDWPAQAFEGLAIGTLDGVAVWVRELRRPENERSSGVITLEQARTVRCLEALERAAVERLTQRLAFGAITVACMLAILDRNLSALDWRVGRSQMAGWFDEFAARPAMRQTEPGL